MRGKSGAIVVSGSSPGGRLVLRPLRTGVQFGPGTWRCSPAAAANNLLIEAGPALFEQSEYRVVLRGVGSHRVTLEHRDPLIVSRFEDDEPQRVDGLVNFRSQIGISTFRVLVDDTPEFEFDIEVFPTKLDYRSDYEEILADVQESLAGLALEYLRATWQGANKVVAPSPTRIEWLTLLRGVVQELEQGLRQIARRPIRGLLRVEEVRRSDQVRRVDNGIRTYLRRRTQRGLATGLAEGVSTPERITERRARPTLDTPEHRWLASQVDRIRRRLADLTLVERERHQERPSERRAKVLSELGQLEACVGQWSRLEPLQAATDHPPAGFASLQLLTAPGYREAYQASMTLSLGLRVEGGPLQLSVKDLNLLYEYWCYLALIRVVAEETKAPIDPRALLEVRDRGLSVMLRHGHESRMSFSLPDGRRVTVRYNPSMSDALVPQQPDMLLTFQAPDWPAVHLVLDAKYRLDASDAYARRYYTAGPPEDALNAMHRYRDAILEEMDGTTRRTVVQAAALFPLRVDPERFQESRLWRALDRIGVGAIPLLPGGDEFLRAWIKRCMQHGGWHLADHAIDHVAIRRAAEWRRAAAEPVLIGVLRGEDPAGHLAWIRDNRRYYTPLAKGQPRLFAAGNVAFYEPAHAGAEGGTGAVRFAADVHSVRVVGRRTIATPWPPRRGTENEEQVLYELGPIYQLTRSIINKDDLGRGRRMPIRIWSSRLALDRARRMEEVFLETEPEWRLYEELRAQAIPFELGVRPPKLWDENNLRGRVLFTLGDARTVAWMGTAGFILRDMDRRGISLASVQAVVDRLRG